MDSDSEDETTNPKMKEKEKKKKDSSEEDKIFIGAKEGDEQDAIEKYIKHLGIDYDTD